MTRSDEAPRRLLGVATACGIAGVVVLVIVDGLLHPSWRLAGVELGLGWPLSWGWGRSGLALLLALALIYDGLLVLSAARQAYTGGTGGASDDSPFRPCPRQRREIAGFGACLVAAGAALFLASGTSAPFSGTALSEALSLLCAANAAGHAGLWLSIRRAAPLGPFQPTGYSLAHREEALALQAGAGAVWAGLALLFFVGAAVPAPCDEDGDHSTSLSELGSCVGGAIQLGGEWLQLHSAGLRLPSPAAVGRGVCLALLWLFDGAVAAAACAVLRRGEQLLCLAPPEGDHRTTARLQARLRLGSRTLLLLGLLTLLLSLSPAAFGAVFGGPDGPAAAKLLSLTLLFHVPPLTVLLRALLQHRQIHMFAPTEWSERSGVPAALTAAADLFCLARCVAAT